jgi:hypothetical protein
MEAAYRLSMARLDEYDRECDARRRAAAEVAAAGEEVAREQRRRFRLRRGA